jgi:hypothetical protein
MEKTRRFVFLRTFTLTLFSWTGWVKRITKDFRVSDGNPIFSQRGNRNLSAV